MKKTAKYFLSLIALILLLGSEAKTVFAYAIPDFPTCSNPQGTILANYDSGVHGIPGESSTYIGSDKVYSLAGGNVTQCFCSTNGNGIQTNWWKFGSLDQAEIQSLINLGWVFIPDGSAWGLAQTAYLAKNSNFSCGGNSTTGASAPVCTSERPDAPRLLSIERSGTKATLTWSKVEKATHYVIAYGKSLGDFQYGVPNTGNVTTFTVNKLDPETQYYFVVYAVNDCMPSAVSTTGGQVLGLAATGDAGTISLIGIIGTIFLFLGHKFKKSKIS